MSVTVCNAEGKIIYMNDKSKKTFSSDGGEHLIGKSVYDCHSQLSTEKIQFLMNTNSSNIYTIEKKGERKMIIQTPYYISGILSGLVEFSFVLPSNIPHFDRD
jgi:transcriptional regulator with PAS, ATPase and Fis domain